MSTTVIPVPQDPPAGTPFNLLFPNVYSSEGSDKILPALFAALENIAPATKDSENPHLRSKYADLAANYEAAKPVLHANKIRVMQPPSVDGRKVTVATILLHESGQWLATTLNMTCTTDDPQAIGKTITYCRRYSFNGFLAMMAEDDDGNSGSGVNGPQQPQNRAPRTPNKPVPVAPPQGTAVMCADCGKKITEAKRADGTMMSVADLVARSHQMYNRQMCGKCQATAAEKAKAAAGAPIGVPPEGAAAA